MKVAKDEKTGLLFRPLACDLATIRQQTVYEPILTKGAIVLDIGGNLGSFAHRAFMNGAEAVYSYEPEPENYRLLEANRCCANHELFNLAIVAEGVEGRLDFWLNSGKSNGMHSLIKRRGRQSIKVDTIQISEVMKLMDFDTVKIDIEGYEYELLEGYIFPFKVKYLALEYHFGRSTVENKTAVNLHEQIIGQGFRCIRLPNLIKNSWADEALYIREGNSGKDKD